MEYCKYHPLSPATFHCPDCGTDHCDLCVDEGRGNSEERCFICGDPVESLGAANSATPFWRRLEEAFKYPLKAETIGLIIGLALVQAIAGYLPFSFIIQLAVFGIAVKYSLYCMQQTSEGFLTAPDITNAYTGAVNEAVRMIALIFTLTFMAVGAYTLVGSFAGELFTMLLMLGLPAILINYGFSESILYAINPLNMFRLVFAIGLPYGLIIGLLMVMAASVGVLLKLFEGQLSILSQTLSSAISYYYAFVMFHLMGYMIFQYQGQLGFVASEQGNDLKPVRSDAEKTDAEISILVKEGEYDKALRLFDDALKLFPDDKQLNRHYFDFLLATGNKKTLLQFATRFFTHLYRTHQPDRLPIAYNQVLKRLPKFRPESPLARYQLAKACEQAGYHKLAVIQIQGMKKEFPEFEYLAEAYDVMATSLSFLPGMENETVKCQKLAQQLKSQKSKQQPQTVKNQVAQFERKPVEPTDETVRSENTKKPDDLPPLEFIL